MIWILLGSAVFALGGVVLWTFRRQPPTRTNYFGAAPPRDEDEYTPVATIAADGCYDEADGGDDGGYDA